MLEDRRSTATGPGVRAGKAGGQDEPGRQEKPAATFHRLLELGSPRHVRHGEYLLRRDEPVDEVFLLRTGVVHLEEEDPAGGRATVAIVRPGGIVGDIPVFAAQEMAFDAVVHEDAIVFAVPRSDFLALLYREPQLSLQWLRNVSCRFGQVQRHVLMLARMDLSGRVAAMLLDARELEPDGRVVVKLSHTELATLVGAKRPSVSRQLTGLRDDAIIETGYRHVEIIDEARLRERAGVQPGFDPCTDGKRPFIG